MEDSRITTIANKYGYDTQSRQLIEEMAELTQAINKFWRKQLDCGKLNLPPLDDTQEKSNIAEEIADVEICIEQVIYLLDIDKEVECIKDKKIERQLKRIAEKEDAEKEDAEKSGVLIKPPCEIGQLAYGIRNYKGHKHIQCGYIREIYYIKKTKMIIVIKNVCRGELGKKVFLTYEEARKALKESEV